MMKRAMVVALAWLIPGAGPAQAAVQQFNLNCVASSGAQFHFRFDLAQRKWCVGPCESVWSINELSEAAIKFSTYGGDSKYNWDVVINRYTAEFVTIHRGYGGTPVEKGSCRPSEFTGFPSRKF